ncbi:MAG: ABC transporter permease [Roseiarcus sp.]|jgi:ribose transport system permease protein
MTAAAAPSRPALPPELIRLLMRVAAVLVIGLALSVLSGAFLSVVNLVNVLRQAALLFFMSSGLTLVVITAGLDLSVGATIGLAACLAGTVIKSTGDPWLGVAAALSVGAAVGLLNGMMVSLLRIPSFIATYGMLWVLQGLTYTFMAGSTVYGFPRGFRQLGNGYLIGIPIPVLLMAALLLVGTLFAQRSVWGQQITMIGANPMAARLSGVPVKRRLILVYTLSGLTAGFAALVFLARLDSAEADIGGALTLPAIAAVLIGGTSLFGGVGTLTGTFVGALLLTLVLNGMNLLHVEGNWQPLVTGLIIIAAVWLDLRGHRIRS